MTEKETHNAYVTIQLLRLKKKFKEMTAELRAMTERINEMDRTITDIRQNLRGRK